MGLFVVLLAGVTTILELWHLLGRLELPMVCKAVKALCMCIGLFTLKLILLHVYVYPIRGSPILLCAGCKDVHYNTYSDRTLS